MFKPSHGESKTKIYKVWKSMKARCLNKNHSAYPRYGETGITVSEDWQKDYLIFKTDMGERPEGYTLERIDNDLGYCKENCTWATRKENQRNRECTNQIEYKGRIYNVKELAEKAGLSSGTLHSRIFKLKWPVEKAMQTGVWEAKRTHKRNRLGQFDKT